ncbi:hypothetical protein MENTO_v1c04720 [Mesoplasma entomophilum]|uniref:Uncharacterized protein n=1 Tax=Mesoplasma entomophilum TaxID=2149 RepID=A0A3S5XZA3_9MOLU|nr:hypothetical protein [Mesoplasma entomophilum]ATQ35608.1 hypothetical protein CS528_02445 [Mesoplasma entomophilum]ATZ19577.1 hypothetical protein MENTO_v1c04720 [Mesoplasma entomophilum]
MPANPKKKTAAQLNEEFKRQTQADSQASMEVANTSGEVFKGKEAEGLLKMIYKNSLVINTAKEKSNLINQYFADLFDPSTFKFVLTNRNGEVQDALLQIFLKYLQNKGWATKFNTAKFKSGTYGSYGFLITKEITGRSIMTFSETEPNIMPVKIIYKNSINDVITKIEVEYEDFSFQSSKQHTTLRRTYILNKDKTVTMTYSIYQKGKLLEQENWESDWRDHFKEIKLNYDFIPVCVLKNNALESPRMSAVETRLKVLDKYDEHLAIAPVWERGGIMFNGSPVTTPTQGKDNYDFISKLLNDAFVQFAPIDMDGQLINLSDNVVVFQPSSTMKTVQDTRNTLLKELREDVGMPSFDEIKSAQQSSSEIVARQFLTSPQLEREKMFVKDFLKDFAYKFLKVLKECNIQELDTLNKFDLEDIVVDIDFDLTTDKNVNQTIQQAKLGTSDASIGLASTPNNMEETNDDQQGLLRRIWNWIKRK